MNTQKKKNKNRPNKPQNPVPPQNVGAKSKDGEDFDITTASVVDKLEIQKKTEDRVPEILSDVGMKQAGDAFEGNDSISPKKPKRNRGKKKKGDKDDTGDAMTTDEFAKDVKICVESQDSENAKIEQDMPKEEEQSMPVPPTNRKKKGKNKGQENTEKKVDPDVQPVLEHKNDPMEENILSKEGDTLCVSDSQEQDTKSSKKKNKKNKKNRKDSEKSEKIEDLSCTGDLQDVADKEIKKCNVATVEKDSEMLLDEPKSQDVKDEGSQGKKKSKKDKKHPPKEVPDEKPTPTQLFNISQDLKPMTFVELPDEKDEVIEIREEDSNIVIVNADVIDDVTTPSAKHVSSNPKAKIAKPVEKKGKDKKVDLIELQERKVAETCQKGRDPNFKPEMIEDDDDLIMCPITDDSPDDVFVEVTKKKNKDKLSTPSQDAPKRIEVENFSTKASDTREFEKGTEISKADTSLKSVTEVVDLSKKHHKKEKKIVAKVEEQSTEEDKTKQRAHAVSLALILGAMTPQSQNLESSNDKVAEPFKEKKQNNNKGSKIIPMPYFATEETLPEVTATATDPKKDDPKVSAELEMVTESISTPLKDKIEIPETKTEKKRNKSPKPAKHVKPDIKLECSKVTEEKAAGKSVESQQCEVKKSGTEAKSSQAKAETSQVEIRPVGLKSESAAPHKSQASAKTPTDITPDLIESPRSTSADIIDDNNNMMIREINIPSPLNIPVVTPESPLISGSGESPKILPAETKVTKILQKKETIPEKSDVKSKMMEVNQDMEDLRLSIEKSLAELTALEKKDDEFGIKPFETKVIDVGVNKDTLHPLTPIQETEIQLKLPTDLVKEQKSADDTLKKSEEQKKTLEETKTIDESPEPPVCPSRKDNKGKNKSKKKDNKQAATQPVSSSEGHSTTTKTESKDSEQETKQEEKREEKSQPENKGKKQTDFVEQENKSTDDTAGQGNAEPLFDPIENFEDAMTSSSNDVNRSFEIIANDSSNEILIVDQKPNPEINITEPEEVEKNKDKDNKESKTNPILSQPKNLLGHPVIPVRSNKMDYKKEKDKTPNMKQAKVKIKDSNQVDIAKKESKESQTDNKPKFIKDKSLNESVTCVTSENDEYVYKYSFRKVFLSSNCNVCKKELKENRVACDVCNLVFYCSQKHAAEDATQHQAFCFAVSTICHLKGQKHIYANTRSITGQDYRLLRMQLIVSCEKILKRKLLPCEQEALLYPRICADNACRDWRVGKLTDCSGCGQISYCTDNPEHFPKSHARWCKSYSLYQKLVVYQLTQGRLEPKLPTKVLTTGRISDNINRLLADMYDEKIDMTDIQYAALTQLATAPLTAAFSYQLYNDRMKAVQANGIYKSPTFTIHVVGAELQFEADSLNKWEIFFLHLKPDVQELRVVLVGPELNPSNLPLDLLGNIKLCPTCRVEKRRVHFVFQDKLLYHEYRDSNDFIHPDIVCAFNPSIHRSASYSHTTWTPILTSIFKLKRPFCITSYSMNELQRDLATVKRYSLVDYNTVSEAKFNPFASVRPDRNFVTDDEIPLLFKNYCFSVLIGAF